MTIEDLRSSLDAAPRAWPSLSPDERGLLLAASESFRLPADVPTVAAVNALLPPEVRVAALPGGLLLAELLTDCGPGGTYEPAAAILWSLPIVPD